MYKFYTFFIILWMMAIGSIVVAFSLTGNPLEQKDIQADAAKMAKINSIQSAIINFAIDTNSLPKSLDELKRKYTYVDIVDNDTNKTFDYKVTSISSIEICTNFKTDSSKNPPPSYSYGVSVSHKKGLDCIPYTVQNFNPTPTLVPSLTPQPVQNNTTTEKLEGPMFATGAVVSTTREKTNNKALYFEIKSSGNESIIFLIDNFTNLNDGSSDVQALSNYLRTGRKITVVYYKNSISNVNYARNITSLE